MSATLPTEYQVMYEEIGEMVRAYRDAASTTQMGVARDAGISRSSVAGIEGGVQRPPIHVLVTLAKVLGVDFLDFLPDSLVAPEHRRPLPPGVETMQRDQPLARLVEKARRLHAHLTEVLALIDQEETTDGQ